MSDSVVYLASVSSTESCDTSYSSSNKEWKLRVRFSPTKENRVHQTKISTKTDKDGFSPSAFRSRLEHKTTVSEFLVCCFCVLFFMANYILRLMGS